jgi:molecular chaperone GrpE
MSETERTAGEKDTPVDPATVSEPRDETLTSDAATPTAPESLTGAANTAGTAAEAPQARIEELERRISELERQLASERDAAIDYMQRWQRAQADFANFKRRAQQEQELVGAQALAGVLPALDSFERAFATLPPSLRHFTWIDGMGLVHLQLHSALQAAGIQPINVEPGSAYDPRRQQAIGEMETGDYAPGAVAVVVQRGYERGGMVLRPALVQLARASSAPAENAGGEAGSQSGQGPAP